MPPTKPAPSFPTISAVLRQMERRTGDLNSILGSYTSDNDDDVLPLRTLMREQWKMNNFDDRTLHVPRHAGKAILPCHPLFNRLVRFAHVVPPRLCVRDINTGIEATHVRLLTDILAFRETVWANLSDDVRKQLDQRQEVYIGILASGGYEFTVAILTALALGAAVVPMTTALPAEEAYYFATKSRAAAVLVSTEALRLGLSLEKLVKDRDAKRPFVCIPVAPSLRSPLLQPGQIIVSSDMYLDDNAPGVVIFTSGTTGEKRVSVNACKSLMHHLGPPKGAVMRRAFIHDEAMSIVDHYHITPDDVLLHVLPVHHATGIGIMFFPFLVAGATLEFRSGSFSPEWTWERYRQRGITFFSGVPTIYMRMMRYFLQNLASRPDSQKYRDGARGLRACLCGTSALPKPIADWWAQLLGRSILLRYGMTETGAVIRVRMGDERVPDGSVGSLTAGCDVRLSEGDQGEIYAKSPGMFSKFLFDPEATAASHTPDGYYKTGDIARKEGEYYWILGRESVDIIKSGGYKLSALDIEREIMALPYILEVMVVGVPDDEFGERVGAVVTLKDEKDMSPDDRAHALHHLTIEQLRQDLRARLAGYKMPTVLRVLPNELPKSATGKVVKKVLGPQFLDPKSYRQTREVQIWDRQAKPNVKL